MSDFIQVVTTVDSIEVAQKIIRGLVEQKIVACGQLSSPVNSTYWWKGRIENTDEWYCVFKTRQSLYKQVEEAIKAMHPYEVPEIIALPISGGSPDYLAWINDVTAG
jgi:periplasmic divalent cation tolerance protein